MSEEEKVIEEEVFAKDILKEQSNEQEKEDYIEGKINWIENDFYDNWNLVREHMKKLWNHGEEYLRKSPEWFFLAHSKDEIRGRPQLIETVQKRIPLVRCAVKNIKPEKNNLKFSEHFMEKYESNIVFIDNK